MPPFSELLFWSETDDCTAANTTRANEMPDVEPRYRLSEEAGPGFDEIRCSLFDPSPPLPSAALAHVTVSGPSGRAAFPGSTGGRRLPGGPLEDALEQ